MARRRNKGSQGTRRQQGRPRATFHGALLAWPGEGTRACGVRPRKPNSLALPVGKREPKLSTGRFSISFRSGVRARKPNSLALPAGRREPKLSTGRFSISFHSGVRARKPNSLALPAGRREPKLSPGRLSISFRSGVRARKPNSLALPAAGREPNLSPGRRFTSSRPAAPSETRPARRGNGADVGVVRRWNKGLRGTRRQHGRPRVGKKAPGRRRQRKRAAAQLFSSRLKSFVFPHPSFFSALHDFFRQKCSFQ